jgi:hypothetical protein
MCEYIISAGQTGADYGALLAASELNIKITGYANKNYWTEDGTNLELKEKFGLMENDTQGFANTDRKNIKLANALIAFRYNIPLTGRGTETGVNYALTGKYTHIPLDGTKPHTSYEGKIPVIVFWDTTDENIKEYAQVLKTFLEKHKPKKIMISGPCKSTKDCELVVKSLLVTAIKQ